MRLFYKWLAAALAYTRIVVAQDNEHKVKGNDDANNATTPHVREGDHIVHFVTVGKATNNFQPNSIRASPGDIVMFQFYPSNHSVIKAAYGYPCVPYEDIHHRGDTFFSGFVPVSEWPDNPPSWNLTINDTQPIFYYCGAPGSCTGWGMVGGINLNASTPLSNQIGLAREADYMLLPGQPWPNEAQQASMASLAATATTATFTVTATPAEESSGYKGYGQGGNDDGGSNENHGLSSGATAGIAIGSAVGALAAAGVLFLMLRTRKLKRKLDAQRAAEQNRPDPKLIGSMDAYAHPGTWPGQQRHMSQLPSYSYETNTYKPPGSDGYAASDVPSRTLSPQQSPYNMQGQQFMPFLPMDPTHRYTAQSELTGSVAPMSELDAPHNDHSNRGSGFSR